MSYIILTPIVLFLASAVITGPAGLITAIARQQWQSLMMLLSPALTAIYIAADAIMNNHDGKHFYLNHRDANFATYIYGVIQVTLIGSVLWTCRREGRNAALLMGHASLVATLIIGFSMGMSLGNDWL